MFEPKIHLLSKHLTRLLEDPEATDSLWAEAQAGLDGPEDQDADLRQVVATKDLEALKTMSQEWVSGERMMPQQDRDVLKRALKAFRKRLKAVRLDDESLIGGGSMSSGRASRLAGLTPPDRYPAEVWEMLASQDRLIDCGQGVYEFPPN